MERNQYLIVDRDVQWFVLAQSYEDAIALWREVMGVGSFVPEGYEPEEMALVADASEILVQKEESGVVGGTTDSFYALLDVARKAENLVQPSPEDPIRTKEERKRDLRVSLDKVRQKGLLP